MKTVERGRYCCRGGRRRRRPVNGGGGLEPMVKYTQRFCPVMTTRKECCWSRRNHQKLFGVRALVSMNCLAVEAKEDMSVE
jgi:hypothetical protein